MSLAFLIQIVIVLAIIGVAVWMIKSIPQIDPIFKVLIMGVVAIGVLLWLYHAFTGGILLR